MQRLPFELQELVAVLDCVVRNDFSTQSQAAMVGEEHHGEGVVRSSEAVIPGGVRDAGIVRTVRDRKVPGEHLAREGLVEVAELLE